MIVQLLKYDERGRGRLTDGTHVYWIDGSRVRWAIISWKKGSAKTRTHGAAASVEEAVREAWKSRQTGWEND